MGLSGESIIALPALCQARELRPFRAHFDHSRGMDQDDIKRRIIELQVEHRDLDEAIERLAKQPGVDELALRRMKKRKLQIKDSIALLQMQLVPDVPA